MEMVECRQWYFPLLPTKACDASSQVIEQVKKYIAQHTTIYVLTDEGGIKPLDAKWEKSTESNGFLHDIYRSTVGIPEETIAADTVYNIRVPLFFVVPSYCAGPFRWIAELNGRKINLTDFITVKCHQLSLVAENFAITDVANHGSATLRVIKYNLIGSLSGNTTSKLIQCSSYKGLSFTNIQWMYGEPIFIPESNFVSMSVTDEIGCFTMKELHNDQSAGIATHGKIYNCVLDGAIPQVTEDGYCKIRNYDCTASYVGAVRKEGTPFEDAKSLDVNKAWSQGIAMIHLANAYITKGSDRYDQKKFDFSLQTFTLQDNFGNTVEVNFNWKYVDGDNHKWKIENPRVVYP